MLLALTYLIYISLGLPDSLLGSGWPVMQTEFGVPSSYAGYVFMSISFMTIISALLSPLMIRRIHTKWIIIYSILLTVIGILGFSFSTHFYMLLLFSVPYGLGAGAVDAAVNHYIANNYSGSVMNFLHCFYGLGAIISPNIMAYALGRATWHEGYRWTSYIQMGIMAACVMSLPLWKKESGTSDEQGGEEGTATIRETLRVPGVLPTLAAFFAYCSGEATCYVWTSSYFAGTRPELGKETVASFGALIFFGLMAGRIISGLLTNKLGDRRMIRCGIIAELAGIGMVALPGTHYLFTAAGFALVGIGMGPVFPGIQHMAPVNFTKRYSAAVIGLQMAAAYTGSTFMPMIFGNIQLKVGIGIMPLYLLIFAALNMGLLEFAYARIRKGQEKQ